MTEATQSLLPVTVTQADREAAADLIEQYWQGAGEQHDQMRKTAASYRAGHTQGVWAVAFARHRISHSLPGDVGMREALKPFADKAAMCDFGDDDYCPDWSPFIPVGAYRKAAAALTPSASWKCDSCGHANISAKALGCSRCNATPSALSGDAGDKCDHAGGKSFLMPGGMEVKCGSCGATAPFPLRKNAAHQGAGEP